MQTGILVLFMLVVFAVGLIVGHMMTDTLIVDEDGERVSEGISPHQLDVINKNFANLAIEVTNLKNTSERHTETIDYMLEDIDALIGADAERDTTEE